MLRKIDRSNDSVEVNPFHLIQKEGRKGERRRISANALKTIEELNKESKERADRG